MSVAEHQDLPTYVIGLGHVKLKTGIHISNTDQSNFFHINFMFQTCLEFVFLGCKLLLLVCFLLLFHLAHI